MSNTVMQRIRPPRRWNGFAWREMWDRRELVEAVVRHEIKMRYRQTVLGVVWVIGQPLITTLILSLLLTRLTGQSHQGIPYPLFVYVAMTSWAYISHGLTKSAGCFISYAGLVNRVYLPRLLVPFAVILAALVDFTVALLILPVVMAYYHVYPSVTILALPLVIALMILTVFGMGIWLAVLNAKFRDIAYALPFLLQLGLFSSPMFYGSEIIPLPWRWLYALNPVVGIVEGMRWTLLNSRPAPTLLMLISTVASLIILLGGLYLFQRQEPTLADVI
jgi:lipopolysaccharide transport system permease protein